MARLAALVDEFAARQGLDPLLPDDEGRFEVTIDADVQIECFERFEQLHLVSPLGTPPVPVGPRRAWFKRLMTYALQRMKHSRSTPALSEQGNVVLLARFGLGRMNVEDLEACLEAHVNALESYRRSLGAAEPPKPVNRLTPFMVRP